MMGSFLHPLAATYLMTSDSPRRISLSSSIHDGPFSDPSQLSLFFPAIFCVSFNSSLGVTCVFCPRLL